MTRTIGDLKIEEIFKRLYLFFKFFNFSLSIYNIMKFIIIFVKKY